MVRSSHGFATKSRATAATADQSVDASEQQRPAGRPRDNSDRRTAPRSGTGARRDRRLRSACAAAAAPRACQPARRPWSVKYASTAVQHSAATRYFTDRGARSPTTRKLRSRRRPAASRSGRTAGPPTAAMRRSATAPRPAAGRQQRMPDAQSGGAGQDDRRQLECRVRHDERIERRPSPRPVR